MFDLFKAEQSIILKIKIYCSTYLGAKQLSIFFFCGINMEPVGVQKCYCDKIVVERIWQEILLDVRRQMIWCLSDLLALVVILFNHLLINSERLKHITTPLQFFHVWPSNRKIHRPLDFIHLMRTTPNWTTSRLIWKYLICLIIANLTKKNLILFKHSKTRYNDLKRNAKTTVFFKTN